MAFLAPYSGAALLFTLNSHSTKASVPHFRGVSNLINDGRHLPQVRRALTGRRRIAAPTKGLIGKVLVRVG